MIYTAYYRSESMLADSADMHAEIDQILAVARERNAAVSVTGALVFSDKRFFQVLEGPRPAVEATLARIGRDRRHTRMSLLYSRSRFERRFSGWAMAYVGAEEQLLARYHDMKPEALPVVDREGWSNIVGTMVEGTR